ncbi:MAG: GWxTD domain-containing protein [bacterium]|nr:GWxTD domain-containing protein [bacterium]
MKRVMLYTMLLLVGWAGGGLAKGLSDSDQALVDSLYHGGMALLEANRAAEAEMWFQRVLEVDEKNAPALVGLGYVYLERGDLELAEDAFMNARRRDRKYAPAHNGLGLVYLQKEKGLQWAIQYFRDAISADRTYAEAYYNMAEAFRRIEDTKELVAYERLAKANPRHPDVWFQIGRIFKLGSAGVYRDHKKAEEAYLRQLEVNPEHDQARVQLGEVLKEMGKTDEAVDMLVPLANAPGPNQRQAMLELAEVYQKRREFDKAELMFDLYLEGLEAEEQAAFYDLRLVASGNDLERFQGTPTEGWKAASDAFWAGRDPAPATAANERKLEHYRRVAYSMEHFGEHQNPWDMRGDVYVRYGKPNHVSSSYNIRFEMDQKVVAVKERLAAQAGSAVADMLRVRNSESTSQGGSVDQLNGPQTLGPLTETLRELSETGGTRAAGGWTTQDRPETDASDGPRIHETALLQASSILGWPVYPVEGKVWEYWIYTDVGPGVEITFTKLLSDGPFRYAEMPSGKGGHSKYLYTWQRMNPSLVMDWVGGRTPVVYRPDFATAPLDFFFDSAGFKGVEGRTDLEVYYGIPAWEISYVPEESGRQVADLTWGVALFNEAGEQVERQSEAIALYSEGAVDTTRRAFVPELAKVSVPPGRYRMAVQVLDTHSGKSQVYNKQVMLLSYENGPLKISGIQMAAAIRPATGGKFVKGDVEVVPNPTRVYTRGQSVFIYYEVYNLKKDEFGATRYQVGYEVRSTQNTFVGARILSGLGQLLGVTRADEVVAIEYEHVGQQADDQGYLELDMSNTEPGEQLLKVKVTDQNSGQQTVGTATFTIR